LRKGNVKEYVERARDLVVDPVAPADVGWSMAYGNCVVASPTERGEGGGGEGRGPGRKLEPTHPGGRRLK
jgi:hypothetical protein